MDRANAVSSVLRDKARELHGNFTVVDKDSVRIRRHPPPA